MTFVTGCTTGPLSSLLGERAPCSSSPTTVADYNGVIWSSLFQTALFHNSRGALFACSVTRQRSHRTARKTGVQSARFTSKPLVSHMFVHRRRNPFRLVILYCVHKNRVETKGGESRSSAGCPSFADGRCSTMRRLYVNERWGPVVHYGLMLTS